MLTLRDAKLATWLTALPNVVMLALLGVYYVAYQPYRAGDDPLWAWAHDMWGGAMFLMLPLMLVAAAAGFVFSFQRIVSHRQRVVLWIIHGAAALAVVWIIVLVARGMQELGRLRM